MKYLFLIFLSLICLSGYSQNMDEVEIKVHKITDHIYWLEGNGGNIGVCIGEDGTFIIDDQFAPLTEKIREAIATITDKPVKFVINTHYHHDHAGGNENFGKEGAIIISHDNSRENIKADEIKRMTEEGLSEFPTASLPIITFSNTMTLHYNGQTIHIFHVDNAHTDGDIIVHFLDENVMHMGDVFVRYGWPYIDIEHGGNINGMIDGLNKAALLANDNTKIIPGHGQIATKQDMVDFEDWLTIIRSSVKNLVDEGKTKEEIIEMNPIKDLVNSDADIDNIISVVYDGLLGSQ